jgi:hypothetical protein
MLTSGIDVEHSSSEMLVVISDKLDHNLGGIQAMHPNKNLHKKEAKIKGLLCTAECKDH